MLIQESIVRTSFKISSKIAFSVFSWKWLGLHRTRHVPISLKYSQVLQEWELLLSPTSSPSQYQWEERETTSVQLRTEGWKQDTGKEGRAQVWCFIRVQFAKMVKRKANIVKATFPHFESLVILCGFCSGSLEPVSCMRRLGPAQPQAKWPAHGHPTDH